jgi:hypothetical protein
VIWLKTNIHAEISIAKNIADFGIVKFADVFKIPISLNHQIRN